MDDKVSKELPWWLSFSSCEELCDIITKVSNVNSFTDKNLSLFCGSYHECVKNNNCLKGDDVKLAKAHNGLPEPFTDNYEPALYCKDFHEREDIDWKCPFKGLQHDKGVPIPEEDVYAETRYLRCLLSRFRFRQQAFKIDEQSNAEELFFPVIIGGFSYLDIFKDKVVYATGGKGIVDIPAVTINKNGPRIIMKWDKDSSCKHTIFRKVRESERLEVDSLPPFYVKAFNEDSLIDKARSEFERDNECILAFDGEFTVFALQDFFTFAYTNSKDDGQISIKKQTEITKEMLETNDKKWVWPFEVISYYENYLKQLNDSGRIADIAYDNNNTPIGFQITILDYFDFIKIFQIRAERTKNQEEGKSKKIYITERFFRLIQWLLWIIDSPIDEELQKFLPHENWRNRWKVSSGIDTDTHVSDLRAIEAEIKKLNPDNEVSCMQVSKWITHVKGIICNNINIDQWLTFRKEKGRVSNAHLFARMNSAVPLMWVVFPVLKMPAWLANQDEDFLDLRELPKNRACGFWLSLSFSPPECDPSLWDKEKIFEKKFRKFITRLRTIVAHLAEIETSHVFWGDIVNKGNEKAIRARQQFEEVAHLQGIEPDVSNLIKDIDQVKQQAIRLSRRLYPAESGLLVYDDDMMKLFLAKGKFTVFFDIQSDEAVEEIKMAVRDTIIDITEDAFPKCGDNGTLDNAKKMLDIYAKLNESMTSVKGITLWNPQYSFNIRPGCWPNGVVVNTLHDPDGISPDFSDVWDNYLPLIYLLGLSRENKLLLGIVSYCVTNELKDKEKIILFIMLKLILHRLHHPGSGDANSVYTAQLFGIIIMCIMNTSVDVLYNRTRIDGVASVVNICNNNPVIISRSSDKSEKWSLSDRGIYFLQALEQMIEVELVGKGKDAQLSKIEINVDKDCMNLSLICDGEFDVNKLHFKDMNSERYVSSEHGMTKAYLTLLRCLQVVETYESPFWIEHIESDVDTNGDAGGVLPKTHNTIFHLKLIKGKSDK
ncbi:MAG: hypothetical protein MRJ65_05980 [Candidatus Brocadiaceae bacterium]|nr:hypothetical protein [Candidatus Brocadiaceae bacterium]